MDYTKIIVSIIALLAALAEAFLVPWLRARISAEKLERMEKLIRIGVGAAEQLYTTEQWSEKKAYVQQYLSSKGYNVTLVEVDAAIEAAVLALHNSLKVTE